MQEMNHEQKKSPLPELEEQMLAFWKHSGVTQRVLGRKAQTKDKEYVFYEGPPTANAAPGLHHVIARAFKDIIPRYKTLRGYAVLRKAGWDTHGLPVELQVEREIGTKTKADIETFGIAAFNKKCKETVWRFKQEWDRFTERIGYWLDLAHPYITYDPSYMESVWWILKQMWRKGLLTQDYKVVPYCSRCETPLSSHEVALGYQDVEDTSVYVKFKVKPGQKIGKRNVKHNFYFLSWTTTPWTLPGNVALAVGKDIDYELFDNSGPEGQEVLIIARQRARSLGFSDATRSVKGSELVGMRYEPLFPYLQDLKPKNVENAFQVLPADFVTTTEGTGIVHTAVMYGIEDFDLGKKYQLPEYHTVDIHGKFIPEVTPWAGKWVKDKEVEKSIIDWLHDGKKNGKANLLFKTEVITHTYPFCWRCKSPLLYYAHESWFVKMNQVKKQLNDNNERIAWVPEHLKHGRFGEWVRDVKDWALSRERYWGTPLPAWVCDKDKKHVVVVGSIAELGKLAYQPNTYILMRHGQATSNARHYFAPWPEREDMKSVLTEDGEKQAQDAAKKLAKEHIDLIISSDLTRTKETAQILHAAVPQAELLFDERLREVDMGVYGYKPEKEYYGFKDSVAHLPLQEQLAAKPDKGESRQDVLRRVANLVRELEEKYRGKTIVLVSHGEPLWLLESFLHHASPEEMFSFADFAFAETRTVKSSNAPLGDDGFLDMHRPYIDSIVLACPDCGSPMHRIKDVIDVWFDAGAMPFAQFHFPFDQVAPGQDPAKLDYQKLVKETLPYPAQYISEAIDQTRGWFYTLLAISTALDLGPSYLNVISIGHVVDEKGEKMSKSKGNVVDPWQVMERYGIDALRWYFYTVNDPGEYKRFAMRDLARSHQELLTILNVLKFWQTYAPEKVGFEADAISTNVLDVWMRSRLADLVLRVQEHLDGYHVFEASRLIQTFIDDLSRWYIRRSRARLQKSESQQEFLEAAQAIAAVLKDVALLLSPFTPFLAEYLWQALRERAKNPDAMAQSVHEAEWPHSLSSPDRQVLEEMGIVRLFAEHILALRAQAGIKIRQPLSCVEIKRRGGLDKEMQEVLKDEVNVREVRIVDEFTSKSTILKTGTESLVAGEVALDTEITETLKQEGLVRELVRTIQEARQDAGCMPQDEIGLFLDVPEEFAFLKNQAQYLQKQTRAKSVSFEKAQGAFLKTLEQDGKTITIGIKKQEVS